MSIRLTKCSGLTSLAIAAKSSGLRMSCFGKAMPPFGHSVRAFSSAASSVLAQLRWSCRIFGADVGSLPASRAPTSKFSQSSLSFASAAPTVIMPSARRPVRLALSGPAVAT